jgi:hypothetical protein
MNQIERNFFVHLNNHNFLIHEDSEQVLIHDLEFDHDLVYLFDIYNH